MADPKAHAYTFNFDDNPSETDTLGFDHGVLGLAKQIGSSNLPVILGLYGRWGAGKTTFLHLLAGALQDQDKIKRRLFAVVFEPWKLQRSDDLLYTLVSALHVRAQETR